MISIDNLSKSYGGQTLFDGISFKLNARERVGIAGRNGHGKTTLLRLLTGQEQPDSGNVNIPKHYRIGYVRQNFDFACETLLQEAASALPDGETDQIWRAEKILSGLGFDAMDFVRHPSTFSGGFQVRLNLAKALLSDPDLLLLDEPTNYLDIASIRWVKQFLSQWPHEIMLITHDRGFMDSLATHILGLHRQKVRKITGNTRKYYDQIAQEEEIYEKTRLNDEKKKREIELFISRFRAKARLANMVQSRVKTLSKMQTRDKLQAVENLEFRFRYHPMPAKQVLRVKNMTFGYTPNKPLIRDLNLVIGRGERWCMIGKNGKGKTTLIKLLAGKLTPQQGTLKYHPSAVTGFYEQTNVSSLDASKTVVEEILYSHPDVTRQLAHNISGAMLFEGQKAEKRISVLSGGEKSRVMLGKLLTTPANMLLLDEPSNHLDMDACDGLLAALDDFEGTVCVVTHNEMFLHALAQKLIVFTDTGIEVFEGTYQDFLDRGGWDQPPRGGISNTTGAHEAHSDVPRLSKKERRQRRSEIVAEKGRVLGPLEKEIRAIEKQIETQEKKLEALNREMVDASQTGAGQLIGQLSQVLHTCQAAIDKQFDRLAERTDTLERHQARFDKLLTAIESE